MRELRSAGRNPNEITNPSALTKANTESLSAKSSAPGLKRRRTHRKTRYGCAECKRRHIRCDKGRPACSNCATAEQRCFYPVSDPVIPNASSSRNGLIACQGRIPHDHMLSDSSHTTSRQSEAPTSNGKHASTLDLRASSPQSQSSQNFADCTESSPGLSIKGLSFDATDLVLFHHAETDMDSSGLGPPGQMRIILSIALRNVVGAPYLLDQVLAFAAMHLSIHIPPRSHSRDSTPVAGAASPPSVPPSSVNILQHISAELSPPSLRRRATVLQTRAVASFTSLTANSSADDTTTAVTRFLFSSLLSGQSWAEALHVLRTENMGFQDMMISLVHCFNLHRGVNAVITRPVFEIMQQTELSDFLHISREVKMDSNPRGSECAPLLRFFESSDLSSASLDACRSAVHSLQWSFDMYNTGTARNGPHAAAIFSVTAPVQYVDMLRKHCPEALVILAFYGVLLHRCRQYWAFRDAGVRIIRTIAKYVAPYWKDSLAWPLQMIELEHD